MSGLMQNGNSQMYSIRRAQGFTLIEVMVALVVVGLALPALLTLVGNLLDSSGYVREKTYAQWVAQNQLETQYLRRQLKGEVLNGSATGESQLAGQTWVWEIVAEQTSVPGMRQLHVKAGRARDNYTAELLGFVYASRK